MKGIVFNLLEEVVSSQYGEEVWDDLLDAADLSGSYTSLGSYSDEDMERLVAAASEKLGSDRNAVLRWFGQKAMARLAVHYPDFFTPHKSARPFVLGVNDIIHAEVRKLYTGAECPHFHIRETETGAVTMDYRSSRRMCALAQGFVEGAAEYFGEEVDFAHAKCVERGDPHCSFHIRWLQQAAA